MSATNPCHLYELGRELYSQGALAAYYSGYPGWRLKPPKGFPLRTHALRTLVTYGLNRLPGAIRPDMLPVFRWQDEGFDRAVAKSLEAADEIHALPGQALQTFGRAGKLGMRRVLNHASGPVWRQNELVAAEYQRAGIRPPSAHPLMSLVERVHRREMEAADVHCVASSLVRDQLMAEGIAGDRVRVIPYGADEDVFFPRETGRRLEGASFKVVFAGQLVLRKGLWTLLRALELLAGDDEVRAGIVEVDCYGQRSPETEGDFAGYRGIFPVRRRGAVGRRRLAEVFRGSDLLVLPSWEEAFGLVVPQALACGCPCVVSDRVGAKDLIRHRQNGSIFQVGSAESLAEEIGWWVKNRQRPSAIRLPWSWKDAARAMMRACVGAR